MLISFYLDATIRGISIYIIGATLSFIPIIIIRRSDYFKDISDFLQMSKFIAGTLNIFIYIISKKFCKNNENKNLGIKKESKDNTKKDYIIAILILLMNYVFFIIDRAYEYFFHTFQSIELFILSFEMKIYSDFKFHYHKIFGLVLFSIFSILIDFIDDIAPFTFSDIVISFIDIILDSVDYTFKKYLMDIKYISPYKVISFLYFTYLIDAISYEIIGNTCGNFIYLNKNIVSLSKIKNNISIYLKLLKSIPIIILYMLFYCFFYKVIADTTVIHGEILNIMLPLILTLINKYSEYDIFKFLKFIFLNFGLFISLLIYIEIIELNFFGLNSNVRRKILEREFLDRHLTENSLDLNDDDSENKDIEFSRGYTIRLSDLKK